MNTLPVPRFTYLGGPTALLEWHGLRLLTDPTFDPPGTTYELPAYTFRRIRRRQWRPRSWVGSMRCSSATTTTSTTSITRGGRCCRWPHDPDDRRRGPSGSARTAVGCAVAQSELQLTDAFALLTATPARHGPAAADRGPVLGFALTSQAHVAVYLSGDTVWFDGDRRDRPSFPDRVALLNIGAAKVAAAGNMPSRSPQTTVRSLACAAR